MVRKHIIDLETILAYVIGEATFTSCRPSYTWGNESQLINWITYKDKQSQLAYITNELNRKYPLIWLNSPVQGRKQGFYHEFTNVRLIIAQNKRNNEISQLNETIWKNVMPTLSTLSDELIEVIIKSKFLKIPTIVGTTDLNLTYRKISNYAQGINGSVNGKTNTIDYWDAIVIDTTLQATENCLKIDLNNYCKSKN